MVAKATRDEESSKRKPRRRLAFLTDNPPEYQSDKSAVDEEDEKNKMNSLMLKRVSESELWNSEKHGVPFGMLDFDLHKDSSVPAKFVVVDAEEDVSRVTKVLTSVWGLSPPSVLLSVTGGARHLDAKEVEDDYMDGELSRGC